MSLGAETVEEIAESLAPKTAPRSLFNESPCSVKCNNWPDLGPGGAGTFYDTKRLPGRAKVGSQCISGGVTAAMRKTTTMMTSGWKGIGCIFLDRQDSLQLAFGAK